MLTVACCHDDVVDVVVTDDAARVLEEADVFLRSKPAEHNLVVSLLNERAAHPEPGRFWWATRDADVVAVMFQSPLDFHAAITPAPPDVVAALAEFAAAGAPDLPGVSGEAGTAARFAGSWAELLKTPAAPVEGQRLYELDSLRHPDGVAGQLRRACDDDADLLLAWLRGFEADTGSGASSPEAMRRRLAAGLVWIWDHDGPVSMAALTPPLAGVTRVGVVYTPPEHRRHGSAAACTAAISQVGLDTGAERCVLYTQLSNPQSNAIYRRLGYEPIQETVRYRFG